MEAAIFLPYHCPRLHKAYFLRSPCAGKVAEAEALRTKFPQALLGPLEHCLNCQGKDLIERQAPGVEYTGDIRPEVTREIVTFPLEAQNGARKSNEITEGAPLLEEIMEDKSSSNPLSQKEAPMAQAETIKTTPPVPPELACKKHPDRLA